jgi:hypothetical protein
MSEDGETTLKGGPDVPMIKKISYLLAADVLPINVVAVMTTKDRSSTNDHSDVQYVQSTQDKKTGQVGLNLYNNPYTSKRPIATKPSSSPSPVPPTPQHKRESPSPHGGFDFSFQSS